MKNFISEGTTTEFTASGQSYVSGQPVPIGGNWGIAAVDIADGSKGTANLCGVYELKKKTGVAFLQGARCYWDGTNKEVTDDSGDGNKIGYAYVAVLSGAAKVQVKLVVDQE